MQMNWLRKFFFGRLDRKTEFAPQVDKRLNLKLA